jgi:DNA-binding transcriptional LysR family regulator
VELYQLRSFVTVAELGHLTRAAEKLHISQPALSAQIKALEEEFELELFARKPSGMVLTTAGKQLVREARKLLAAAQALRMHAQAVKGEIGGVARVGTLSDPQLIRVGELMSAAVERYPLIDIELHHAVTGVAFDKVREGELDASFYYGELTHPDVNGVMLRDITYRIVGPASWGARIEAASWKEIAAQPWVMPPSVSTHHQLASELFDAHGICPTKVVEADDELVVGSLVVSEVGMGLMREDLALDKAAAGQVVVWSDTRLTTPLKFLYPRARGHDGVIRALVELVADVWQLAGDGERWAVPGAGAVSAPAAAAGRTARAAPASPGPAAPAGSSAARARRG